MKKNRIWPWPLTPRHWTLYNFKNTWLATLCVILIKIFVLAGQRWALKYRLIVSIKHHLDALKWDNARGNSGEFKADAGFEMKPNFTHFLANICQLYENLLSSWNYCKWWQNPFFSGQYFSLISVIFRFDPPFDFKIAKGWNSDQLIPNFMKVSNNDLSFD